MLFRLARPVCEAARTTTQLQFPLPSLRKKLTTPYPSLFSTTTMAPTDLPTDRRPLVISGPSGVGKGTLFTLLRERHPDTFALSVSHTTRGPRAGEAHGTHYYFVTRDDFERLIAEDGFIEHAQFGGNRYGTSKQTVRDQAAKGQVVVLDIEMEGVKQLKRSDIEARYVFVAPPSAEELERRLKGRGTESEADVAKRLDQAKYVRRKRRVAPTRNTWGEKRFRVLTGRKQEGA